MKKQLTLRLLTCLILGLAAGLATATQAQQMNYQGRLTDNAGQPLADGQYTLTFNVYTAATGDTANWGPVVFDGGAGDGHAAKADLVNGRFNVVLGPLDTDGDPITDAFRNAGGSPRYLGITVGTDTANEIAPRQQILAAPEAIHAAEADHATTADNFTSAVLFPDESNERVGIGIDNPSVELDVAGDFKVSGTARFGGEIIGETTFQGNVGIGTASPTVELDVNGEVIAGGSIDSNHFLITGNQIIQQNGAAPADMYLNLNGGNVNLTSAASGNVGIGTSTPESKLEVVGDITATGSINGEKHPLVFNIGNTAEPLEWHALQIPGATIQEYLGDEDGGTIRVLLQRISDDFVHNITEHVYIEQPSKSLNNTPGLHGSSYQTSGDERTFVLGTATKFELIPHPWNWIYMRNYETGGLPGLRLNSSGPAFQEGDVYEDLIDGVPIIDDMPQYRVDILVVPNVIATVVIHDR